MRSSLSTLLLFELVFKLATAFVLMPASVWLLGTAVELSRFEFVSSENYLGAIFSPLILLALVIVLLVFTVYTMFEISFLTLTYNQGYHGKPIGFLTMLRISGHDAIRLAKPKNYLLIPLLLIVIPVSNSAVLSSVLKGLNIPEYMKAAVLGNTLYMAILAAVLIFVFLLIMRFVFTFHIYTLEDKSVKTAFRECIQLISKRFTKCVVTFGVCQLCYTVVIYAAAEIILLLLTLLSYAFAYDNTLYAFLLTVNTAAKNILSFIVPSLLVVSGYSVLSSLFFKLREESDVPLPKVVSPKTNNMKKGNFRVCVVVTVICLVGVFGAAYTNAREDILGSNQNGTLVMAHRGASRYAPENTIPAFEQAIELQADYIELDVQEAADGTVVVTHDSNFKRCTGVNANVWNMTFDEIEQLDAGYRFSDYKGTKIPSLREVLELCKGRIKLNIELKRNGHEKNLEESVADLITEYGMQEDCVITSLDAQALWEMKRWLPDIQCGYIISASIGDYYDMGCSDFFSVEQSYVTPRMLSELHKRGKSCNAWTVNDKTDIEKMISVGTDSIITDDPLLAREVIATWGDPLGMLLFRLK